MTHRVQPTRTRAARGSRSTVLALGLLMATAVHAQQPPATQVQKSEPALAPPGAQTAPQAAPPAAAPSWQQGRSDAQSKSTLHPIAPILTGRPASELPLDKLKVPAGFKVEVWADGIPEARSLALGDKGTVFVSNRNLSDVYAVVDRNGKREVKKVLSGLNSPNGLAFSKGTLFVAERNRITRFDGIEDKLDTPPAAKVVVDNLDPEKQAGHFWKYLALGPDGKLYYNVGAPGNIVMPAYYQATVNRVDPASGKVETVAQGVRNSVGMAFDPKTKDLWFTNHGRDWVDDDTPNDTLHHLTRKGMNFGYPYCHQGDVPDPEFGKVRSCAEFDKPALKLGGHVAPLGMKFYTGTMFPAEYRNNMFIALHGSWNRSNKQGYSVVRVVQDGKGGTKMVPFLEGFLEDPKADPPMWGRPVDVLVMRDGSLLVSDDYNGVVYRVSHAKK